MTRVHLFLRRRPFGGLLGLCALGVLLPAWSLAVERGDVRSLLSKADGESALSGSLMPTLDRNSDIQVSATHMGADRVNNRVTLDEAVVIRFSDITVRCDRATYDATTGDVHAEGNVSVTSAAGGSWSGDRLDFNHRTGAGLVGAGLLRLGTFSVRAGEDLVRDNDGIFYAHDTTLSTCANDEAHWHWSVTGDARYKDREFVEMRNAVGRVYGIPLFWAPYFYRDLNTHYGWRVMPGYTDKWGAYLRLGYVYPLAGSAETGSLLYGKTMADLRSRYGAGIGQELNWTTEGLFGEETRQRGRLTLYYANFQGEEELDTKDWPDPNAWDRHRWSIGLEERLDFSPRDFLSIVGERVSDPEFRSDYKETSLYSVSQPRSIVNYEHRENDWTTSIAVMAPLNTFYAGVRRLPEWRIDFLPRNLFGISKLYYESQTAIGYLGRQPEKHDGSWGYKATWEPGPWVNYDTWRFDTRHILRRPFTLTEGVTLTPRLGWRGTYYSDAMEKDDLFRSLFELGMTLQARAWRDFEGYRHTVIPYLDFTCVPASQAGAEDVPYAFDRLDQEFEWRDRFVSDGLTPSHRYTGLRLGLRNFLQKRTESGLSDYLSADLYGTYVFQTQDHWVRWRGRNRTGTHVAYREAVRLSEETGWRLLGLDTTLTPTKNLHLSSDFQYDPEENRLAFWDINGKYRLSSTLTLYAGYLVRHHELYDCYWSDMLRDRIVYGGFVHHLCDTIDWSAYARYNLEYGDLEEVGGYVQYNLDCISLRVSTEYDPVYTSLDGRKHSADFRVAFDVWLRAFPKTEEPDWMSWGNLSNLKNLQED